MRHVPSDLGTVARRHARIGMRAFRDSRFVVAGLGSRGGYVYMCMWRPDRFLHQCLNTHDCIRYRCL